MGLAQAKAIEAQGLAEASAILKKAAAWKEFNEAAKLQTILERLPSILEASAPVFGAVAAPLGNIDKIVVIDQGNGQGASGINRLASTAPSVIFNFLQQLEAFGLNVPNLLSQLGVRPDAEAIAKVVEPVLPRDEKIIHRDCDNSLLINDLVFLSAVPSGKIKSGSRKIIGGVCTRIKWQTYALHLPTEKRVSSRSL